MTAIARPAATTRGSALSQTALAQALYVAGRHLRFFFRQPWFVGISLVQPVIWLLLFGQLFKSVTQIPGFSTSASYLDYLVPGVLVMTALFSCGWSGMSIIEDLDRSIIDRYLATPMHRSAIIVGLNLYSLVSLGIQAAIIGALAWLLGAKFEGGLLGYGALTLCALLVGATVAAFSDAMALRMRQRESVIGINTMLTLPLTFLSAAFMPLKLVPDWIATADLESGELGSRGGARRARRESRMAVHPAAHRGAPGPCDPHDDVGDAHLQGVPAVDLDRTRGVGAGRNPRRLHVLSLVAASDLESADEGRFLSLVAGADR